MYVDIVMSNTFNLNKKNLFLSFFPLTVCGSTATHRLRDSSYSQSLGQQLLTVCGTATIY